MELIRDLRFAVRTLGRSRGFTVAAILTLALGIGANTAIFTVVSGVLLQPLPYDQPDRLAMMWETDLHNQVQRESASWPDYRDWRASVQSFGEMAAWTSGALVVKGEGTGPERIQGAAVSAGLFSLLGVHPAIGRVFTPDDDSISASPVVLLSEGAWKRRYGSDPSVLGRQLEIGGRPHTVVGVMPSDFSFPGDVEVWIPISTTPPFAQFREQRGVHNLRVIGRLKDGASVAEAQSELSAIMARLADENPEDNVGRGAYVEPLTTAVVGAVRPGLLVLLGAVTLVLLIACANVANLLLARGTGRSREIAIRRSLGASRLRLVRQLLTESLLLGIAGGLAGLLLGFWGSRLLLSLAPATLPRAESIGLDWRVLLFTFVISVAATAIFGLIPALRLSARVGGVSLRQRSAEAQGRGTRRTIVIAEVALAVILAVGSGLLIKSLWRMLSIDAGFRPEGVLSVDLKLPDSKYPMPPREEYPKWPSVVQFDQALIERVKALPGVQDAALALNHPLESGWTSRVVVAGRPESEGPKDESRIRPITPDYFHTVGIRLEAGRSVASIDTNESSPVVVVNEAFVRKYLPAENPLDHSVQFWGTTRRIVGVVGDVRFRGLDRDSEPAVYAPLSQVPMSDVSLLVRSSAAPESLTKVVRDAIWSVDSDVAVYNIHPLEEIVQESMGPRRFYAILLSLFGALAVLLAAVGVYGVISYQVMLRIHEIGVRYALGARKGQVVRLIVGEGAWLALVGVALGVIGAEVLSRFLAGMLFEVSRFDATILAAVAVLIGSVAALASLVPARRAGRVEPAVALRYE